MVNSFNIDGVDIKYEDMTAKQILYVLKKIEKIRAIRQLHGFRHNRSCLYQHKPKLHRV